MRTAEVFEVVATAKPGVSYPPNVFTVVGKAGARALARWLITHQNVLKVEIESTGKRAVINE